MNNEITFDITKRVEVEFTKGTVAHKKGQKAMVGLVSAYSLVKQGKAALSKDAKAYIQEDEKLSKVFFGEDEKPETDEKKD